jgi:hypothetical protein
MKFTVARTRLQRDHLDSFFESFTLSRSAETRELILQWRPGRFFGLLFGLPAFFFAGVVIAITLWIQSLAPGIAVSYADIANPAHWSLVAQRWHAYQNTAAANPNAPLIAGSAADLAADASARADARAASDGSTGPTTVYSVPDSPIVSATPYGPLLTRYFTSNGGTQKLLGILSIQIHGTVTMDSGETLSFTMVKKPPGKIRINMHDTLTNNEATVITDGHDTWKWSGDAYQTGVHPAPPDEAAALVRESFYCDVPVEIIHNPHALREIPRVLGEDEHFNYVQTLLGDGMRALIFLNPDTWHADRIQIDYDQNGIPCSYTILVRNWMTVDGIAEPSLIDVYVNGTHLLQCAFDSITFNPGAYDVLFQPPAEASIPSAVPPIAEPTAAPAPAASPPS